MPGFIDPDYSPDYSPSDSDPSQPGANSSTGTVKFATSLVAIATSGSPFDRLIRGFFVGTCFGLLLAVVLCCWVPCLGKPREWQRRQQTTTRDQQNRRSVRRDGWSDFGVR